MKVRLCYLGIPMPCAVPSTRGFSHHAASFNRGSSKAIQSIHGNSNMVLGVSLYLTGVVYPQGSHWQDGPFIVKWR